MPTLVTNLSVVRNGSALVSTSVSTAYDNTALEFDDHTELPASTTNFDLAVSITAAQIAFVYLYSAVGLVIKTNSTSVPDQTITLVAGKPLKWATGDADACPLEDNLTHLYVTTTTAETACLFLIGVNL